MAFLKESMTLLGAVEFSSQSDILHYNRGERGYTYFGIYQEAHPRWSGWKIIYKMIGKVSIKRASVLLARDKTLLQKVHDFYRVEFWDEMKLDLVKSQHIANEMFIFGTNTNPTRSIKKAQKVVGVKTDGWIGAVTLQALNNFDEKKFDIEFDKLEIAFYKYLAFGRKRARFNRFYKGWLKRAKAV